MLPCFLYFFFGGGREECCFVLVYLGVLFGFFKLFGSNMLGNFFEDTLLDLV